ncbi:hypothetical protein B0H10DRAFT_1960555 [Mycena sp. CBHHK59/15]|nr:hypothetical protein B0H10DRAFT_1960555 [Mycena sp. CBHHK59/15]
MQIGTKKERTDQVPPLTKQSCFSKPTVVNSGSILVELMEEGKTFPGWESFPRWLLSQRSFAFSRKSSQIADIRCLNCSAAMYFLAESLNGSVKPKSGNLMTANFGTFKHFLCRPSCPPTRPSLCTPNPPAAAPRIQHCCWRLLRRAFEELGQAHRSLTPGMSSDTRLATYGDWQPLSTNPSTVTLKIQTKMQRTSETGLKGMSRVEFLNFAQGDAGRLLEMSVK